MTSQPSGVLREIWLATAALDAYPLLLPVNLRSAVSEIKQAVWSILVERQNTTQEESPKLDVTEPSETTRLIARG